MDIGGEKGFFGERRNVRKGRHQPSAFGVMFGVKSKAHIGSAGQVVLPYRALEFCMEE